MEKAKSVEDIEREKKAKQNADETAEAHRLAAERRAQDERNSPPLVQTLAGSIKEKLEALNKTPPPGEQSNDNPTV